MRLLVISGVEIFPASGSMANSSFGAILDSYEPHFREVGFVGPAASITAPQKLRVNDKVAYAVPGHPRTVGGNLRYFIKQAEFINQVKWCIEDFKPDLIQIRIPAMFTLCAWPAVQAAGIPVTSYIAGDWYTAILSTYRFPGVKYLAALLSRSQNSVIRGSIPVTAGPALARALKRIADCHIYMSTTHDEVVRRRPGEVPNRLLTVGRLEPLKRTEDAIRALAILRAKGAQCTLKIAGEGKSRAELEALVARFGLEKAVTFLGQVSVKDMPKLYCEADVLLHPSTSEGSPKCLAEAMAHGVVPIAVQDVGSIGDIISQGVNGILVPPKSPDSIANAVLSLQKHSMLYRKMVDNALDYAEQHCLSVEVRRMWEFVFDKINKQDRSAA